MHAILRQLAGGDRRSIGNSSAVVSLVLSDPSLFAALFSGILSDDPVVRMRAADAAEKVTVQHPEYLQPYKDKLIAERADIGQKEFRWHVAQMLPRLELNDADLSRVLPILFSYLNDRSRIVKTCAMQALADLAKRTPQLRPSVLVHLRELTITGTPAMKARGRRLIAQRGWTPQTRADLVPDTSASNDWVPTRDRLPAHCAAGRPA
jgi:hypothetical protein